MASLALLASLGICLDTWVSYDVAYGQPLPWQFSLRLARYTLMRWTRVRGYRMTVFVTFPGDAPRQPLPWRCARFSALKDSVNGGMNHLPVRGKVC